MRHESRLVFVFLAVVVGWMAPHDARAQTPTVDLSVNGAAGTAVRWGGPRTNAAATTVLVRGDLNGDLNRRDLIVGAPGGGDNGQGQVFGVFMGPTPSGTVNLSTAPVIVTGEAAGDQFGAAIGVGPVIRLSTTAPPRDLVVGAPGAAGGRGTVYLFPGLFATPDMRSAAAAPFKIIGNTNDHLGSSIVVADVDGDGYGDFLMLASGSHQLYVVYGRPGMTGLWDLSVRRADITITLPASAATVTAGDFNNDRRTDIAVGLPSENGGAGGVYLIFGRARDPLRANLALPANADLVFAGIDAGDHAGTALDAADFDGDGVTDLIATAPDGAGPGNRRAGAGEAYVLFGGTSFSARTVVAAPDVTVYGSTAGYHLGGAISHGNIRRDLENDLVFLSSGANLPAGELDVVYGDQKANLASTIDLANGADRVLLGDRSAGPIRTALVIDVTGEGAEDIVAGVPGAANGSTTVAGMAYIAYSPRLSSNPLTGTMTAAQGSKATTTINVTNGGTTTVSWLARSNTSWLTLGSDSGASSANTPGPLTLTASPASLPTGVYHGGISVLMRTRDLLYSFSIPVDLTVTPGNPVGTPSTNPFGVPDPPDEGSPNGVATAVGTDVQVLPIRDVLVTFAQVSVAGRTTVEITPGTADSGPGFRYGPWFYRISTTATYSGPVTVGIAYDAALVSRWEGAVRVWSGTRNITTHVDGARHLAFGVTNSIDSVFSVVDDPRGVTVGNDSGFDYYGSQVSGSISGAWSIYRANLDGDAASDYFLYNRTDGRWKMAINNGLGMFRFVDGQWAPGWQVWPMDLNGDGYDDIFLHSPASGVWFKVLNDRHGGFTYVTGQWSVGWTVTPVDLNGDLRTDLFLYNPSTGVWYEVFNEPSGEFRYVLGQWSAGWSIYPADLNGDGLSDLFLYNASSGAWADVFNSTSGTFTYQSGQWGPGLAIYPVKANADRATDLFLYQPQTGSWSLARNTGSGAFSYTSGSWPAGLSITPVDVNADGRVDLFLHNTRTGAWSKAITSATGDFAYQSGRWTLGWVVTPGDLNGDGRADLWLMNATGSSWFSALDTAQPTTSDPSAALGDVAAPGGATVDRETGNTNIAWSPGWRIIPMRLERGANSAKDLFLYNDQTGRWTRAVNDGTGLFSYSGGAWAPGWKIWPMDLNADGYDDLFLYNPGNGAWSKVLNDQHGGFTYVAGQWGAGWSVTPIDLNGDGRSDLFLYNPGTGAWFEVFNEAAGTFRYVAGQWSPGWTVQVADLNGDGLSDLFLYNASAGTWYEVLNSASGAFTYQGGQWIAGLTIYPVNVNGDKLADLFLYNAVAGNWFVAQNTGGGTFAYTPGQWAAGLSVVPVDANGDGRTDLLIHNPKTGAWTKAMMGVTGEFTYQNGRWQPGWAVTLADVNGDGRADVILYNQTTGALSEVIAR